MKQSTSDTTITVVIIMFGLAGLIVGTFTVATARLQEDLRQKEVCTMIAGKQLRIIDCENK